jgi:DNA-binding transcriptional regulator GbsR (MarR family)
MRKDIERFVERAGLLWENDGLPRIAGRIFGLMLISEEALSLDEIADALGVSKASVSTDTRLLERMGFIERVSKPGDRKDYYQQTETSSERAVAARIRRMHELEALIESGKELAVTRTVRQRLADHHFVFSQITKTLEATLEALQERHRAAAGT